MKIDCLVLGAYQTNNCILRQSYQSDGSIIIDMGLQAGRFG